MHRNNSTASLHVEPRGAARGLFTSFARLLLIATALTIASQITVADVFVPNIFTDHMVLQQHHKNKVWGKATPNEKITVSINDTTETTAADQDGHWSVLLDPLQPGGPHELILQGDNRITIKDVLVGEVWICSGQSNMEWPVSNSNDPDLVQAGANTSEIRMINFPNVGSQELIWTHDDSSWMVCSPATVGQFSAVGYFFGKQLHETIRTPIGLINSSWGGSAADSWIDRNLLEADSNYKQTLARWQSLETQFAELSTKASLSNEEQKLLEQLRNQMSGNQRPANLYNGILKSHLGYGMKGVIWYQGESNARRAYQYRDLFPMLIANWRSAWGQGDFPFYWVQLADFMDEKTEPGESAWAELREAQTMAMAKLPNTGEAVIIDIGEGKDIHPRNKAIVGQRLARWALANQYGIKVACHCPIYKSMEKKDNEIVLSFEHVDKGWRPFDVNKPLGFAIAGADRKFFWAKAKIIDDDRVAVSCEQLNEPVAVRYAWADNPQCNMFNGMGLPLTPFRTDDWPGITLDNR